MALATPTTSALPEESTPAQGALNSAGAGITGGNQFLVTYTMFT